jgi:hypothetical protein
MLVARAYLDGLGLEQRRAVEHWLAKSDGAYGGRLYSLQAVEHQAEFDGQPHASH